MRLQQIFSWAGPLVPAARRGAEKDEVRAAAPRRDGGVSGVQVQAASDVSARRPEGQKPSDDGVDIVV